MTMIKIDEWVFTLEQLSIAFRYAAADTLDTILRAKLKAIADAIDEAGLIAAQATDSAESAA